MNPSQKSINDITANGDADVACDMLVLGAGPGGYSAAFRAADLGMKTVLVERHANLGGVCLNVGCIPSKTLLHVASVLEAAQHLSGCGVQFGSPKVDLAQLRTHKDNVVSKLTQGLAAMAKMRKVISINGTGQLVNAHCLQVEKPDGSSQRVHFRHAILAAGSEAVKLPFLPQDERIVTSTGALALKRVPRHMLVIGGGVIGLEMATVYSALGSRITVVEMQSQLMQGVDRAVVQVWQKMNAHRFDGILLNTRVIEAQAMPDAVHVVFESAEGQRSQGQFDLVLQAVGRTPNGKRIGADKAGIQLSEQGHVLVDAQMRTSVPHIHAIGDIVGQPMLAHKAVHEAHVAAEAASGDVAAHFEPRVIPSVAYTDPEVAWVGLTEIQAAEQGIPVRKGVFPWMASGRALANGRPDGMTQLLFDVQTQRIVGGSIVGTHAGDLISEVALAIEMGATALDIGKTIHPHPTLGESVGMAAEAAHGTCTDLPPSTTH